MNFSTREFYAAIKRLLPTLIFYGIAIAAVIFLNKISPSGPCTPGWGILSFFLLMPVIFGLMIYNIYLTLHKNKRNGIVAALHAIVLVSIFVMLIFG